MPKLPKLELDIGDIHNIDMSTLDTQIEDFMNKLPPGVDPKTANLLKSALKSIKDTVTTAAKAAAKELENRAGNKASELGLLKENPLVSVYKYITSASLERKFLTVFLGNIAKNTDIQKIRLKQVLDNVGEYKQNGGLVLKESGDIGVNVRKKDSFQET